jgi:hypothetical protein
MKLRVAAVAVALAIAGCGYDAATSYPPPADVTVSIVGLPGTLAAGDIVPVQVHVRDAAGHAVPDPTVTLVSSDPAVALIDGAGRVRAVAPGMATIRASVAGGNGSAPVVVTPGPASFALRLFDGITVPRFFLTDTVSSGDGTLLTWDVYLESGSLTLTGGMQPGYQTTLHFLGYLVSTDAAGQRHLILQEPDDVRDEGSVSYDARGDLKLTSEVPTLMETASADTSGFDLGYRFTAADTVPKAAFFGRQAR